MLPLIEIHRVATDATTALMMLEENGIAFRTVGCIPLHKSTGVGFVFLHEMILSIDFVKYKRSR